MKYAYMIEPYMICIINGIRKIDDIKIAELKQGVINALASKGLGPDGKPLPKEPEEPIEEVDEPKEPIEEVDEAKDSTIEEEKEEPVEEPQEPVEEVVEEEPSKDTKEEDKSPVEEDKGAK